MHLRKFFHLTFLLCFLQAFPQSSPFTIKHIDQPLSNKIKSLKTQDSIFYQDEKYIVTRHCGGEFGGAIIFKDKATGLEYGCKSQCAVIINKLNEKYYVSNTLSHGNAFSDIIEIVNPRLLERNNPNKMFTEFTFSGSRAIFEIQDFTILLSFQYENQLYHIITDDHKAYLIKTVDNRYQILDILSDKKGLYIFDPQIINVGKNHFLIFDKDDEDAGFMEVYENVISINSSKT